MTRTEFNVNYFPHAFGLEQTAFLMERQIAEEFIRMTDAASGVEVLEYDFIYAGNPAVARRTNTEQLMAALSVLLHFDCHPGCNLDMHLRYVEQLLRKSPFSRTPASLAFVRCAEEHRRSPESDVRWDALHQAVSDLNRDLQNNQEKS